jgi:hypothetical protein
VRQGGAALPSEEWVRCRVEGEELRIELRLRLRLGSFGRIGLYFVSWTVRGFGVRGQTILPASRLFSRERWRKAELREVGQGAVLAQVSCRASRGVREVRLPLAALGRPARLYIKAQRHFGFFDQAGWYQVVAGD